MQIGKLVKNKILSLPIFHKKNRKSFVISIVIHLTLIIVLIFLSLPASDDIKDIDIKHNNQRTEKIVQATMINVAEIKSLQEIETKKQAGALALKKAIAADKKKAIAAQKAANKAKQRLKKAKKQYVLNQKRLKLKRKKDLEKAKQVAKQKKIDAEKEKVIQLKKLKEKSLQAMRELTAKKIAEQKASARKRKVLATTTNKYIALIQQTIRANWTDHGQMSSKLSIIVSLILSSNGKVLNIKIMKPSGNTIYDRQAVLAIEKSSPLPMPKEATLVKEFQHMTLELGGNT